MHDASDAPSETGGPVGAQAAGPWLTFPLARGWAMRALGAAADEAAEWLRLRAMEEVIEDGRSRPRIRTTYTRSALMQHEANVPRHVAWTDRRKGDEEGHYCHLIRPGDDFRSGPGVMDEHRTKEHTRWYAPDIGAVLAEETAPARAAALVSTRGAKKRGRRATWDWQAIAHDATLAHDREGGAMQWKNLVTLIMELAERQTGTRPKSDSEAERLAGEIQRAWNSSKQVPDN